MTTDAPSTPRPAAYDAIVVGGRAAGAATAMLLARSGLRVALFERGVFGTDTLSTHALMRGGVLQLARWGVLDQIVAAGTPPVTRTTFRYASQQVVIPVKPAAGVDALYAPRRLVLDAALVDAARHAGAVVADRTPVVDLLRRRDRVAGVVVRTAGGRLSEVHAPLVIGADGVRSTVAGLVDAPTIRTGSSTGACSYGYWTGVEADGYEWVFRPNAASGVIPTNDDAVCVFGWARPERIGRGGVDTIVDIVAEGAPETAARLRAGTAPEATRTWTGHRGFVRQAYGPGWALVGDAGHFKDPISAHGITDALRDAELLARAVVAGSGDTSATDHALAEFATLRDRLSRDLFEVTDEIAGHRWDDDRIAELLLDLSAAMAAEIEVLSALDAEVVA